MHSLISETLEVEAEGSGLQGYFYLYMEFETSLVYVILNIGVGEMLQQVKALVAPTEDLGIAPFTPHVS